MVSGTGTGVFTAGSAQRRWVMDQKEPGFGTMRFGWQAAWATTMLWIVLLMLLISPAGSVTTIISPGDQLFIGEEGLDVRAAVAETANQIAWFSPGSDPDTDVPALIIPLGNKQEFYVSPSQFGHATGIWYSWNRTVIGPAFQVQCPALTLRVWNQETGEDVSGLSIAPGTLVNFRIETNMASLTRRAGYDPASDGYLSIVLVSPMGSTLTSVAGPDGTLLPLKHLDVNSSLWYWVPPQTPSGWDTAAQSATGSRLYPSGTYIARLDYNVNHLQDNTEGSALFCRPLPVQVALASERVSASSGAAEVVRGNPFTITISGVPGADYYLWVKSTGSMSGNPGDQPPQITPSQEGVLTDPVNGPYAIGSHQISTRQAMTIRDDVPPAPANGTPYYALVTLTGSGVRTVQWQTSSATDDRPYTFQVERVSPGGVSFDEVSIVVVRGSVSIGTGPPRSFFLGEQVLLAGTNTESDTVYLFMTGPNLPSAGGSLTNPRIPVRTGQPESFTAVSVDPDNTWEYRWFSGNLGIDAGTYTVYAVAGPASRTDLSLWRYSTSSFSFARPFVTAGIPQATVARGDPVEVRGTATGNPDPGVALWIFGINRFLYATEEVNADGSFTYTLNEGETTDLATGQYYLVIQHPGYTDTFDVYPSPNRQLVLSSYPVPGSALFRVGGPGALMSSQAADALVRSLASPFIDDTYVALSFLLVNPQVTIAPPGNSTIGGLITLSGTTNLAPGNQLLVEVTSQAFGPSPKEGGGAFSGVSGIAPIREGSGGQNNWSFSFDTDSFVADTYLVTVSGVTVSNAVATTSFSLSAATPTPTPSTPATPQPTITIPTTDPTPLPTTTASLSWFALAGAVVFILIAFGSAGRNG